MPGFKGLAVPGPSNMPFRIRQAMDIALEDHRAPTFLSLRSRSLAI
jgi:alanine-glyoxylate transaminase/serine-glyoxylate transaminase/serine-pyruvate transaminase